MRSFQVASGHHETWRLKRAAIACRYFRLIGQREDGGANLRSIEWLQRLVIIDVRR